MPRIPRWAPPPPPRRAASHPRPSSATVSRIGPPPRQSVTLTLALKVNVQKSHGSGAPLTYRVEVSASDDNGNFQGFDQAGTLRLLSKAKGPKAAPARQPIDASDHEKQKARKHETEGTSP